MFTSKQLLSILAFALLMIGIVLMTSAASALPASLADTPGPLPNDCQEVTVDGEDPPACCAFGYVYFDGVPVNGAQVTIEGPTGSFSTTTSTGPASTDAYYRVNLSAPPLTVAPGDIITVTATYSDSSASTIYQVVGGGQQVDVVFYTDLIGSNFPISQWLNEQTWPSIAYNSSASEYLVAWWDYRDTPDADVYGQRVSSSGTLQGSNFQISPDSRKQLYTAVAYNSTNAEYLVVWEEHINESDDFDIYGQRVSSTGGFLGSTIHIATAVDSIQAQPAVAYNNVDNQYLVVWHDNRYDPDWDVFGQRVSSTGTLLGSDIPISVRASAEANADVVHNATANEYFVVWRDERSQTGEDGTSLDSESRMQGL